jgi:hypothetical protein
MIVAPVMATTFVQSGGDVTEIDNLVISGNYL